MNRAKIKQEAKTMIKGNIWNILLPFIVAGLISVVASGFGTAIAGDNEQLASLLSLVMTLAVYPLELGATYYVMKFVRKESFELNDIFSFYKKFWPVVALMLLITVFTTLWTLLLIIPGIIAAYSYMMAPYLMIDGEDNPKECIDKSKAMMKGYKMDYFVFQLSFIGWILLSILTFGILLIYVVPYMTVSQVLYYEELKKIQQA